MGIPPGMDPAQAKMAVEFLKANPAYAQNTMQQLSKMMQNPQTAEHLLRMQATMASPEYRGRMMSLKEDPELRDVFDDISKRGPKAIAEYWNDMDLMSKISKKMAGATVAPPNGETKATTPQNIDSLQAAAKLGNVEAIKKFISEGDNINQQDGRGITPLGVAVGFNRVEAVKELLANDANVNLTDKQGNTVLHYAAGYGRVEAAQLLLDAGADIDAMNNDNQTPLDVAELNREVVMVKFLKDQQPKAESEKYI